jgi:hypothetical protein
MSISEPSVAEAWRKYGRIAFPVNWRKYRETMFPKT